MKRFASLSILLAACAGCHMCSDCCDYSSPVPDSPYGYTGGRAGSTLSGGYMPGKISAPTTNEEAAAARAPAKDLTPMLEYSPIPRTSPLNP